jgi:hypothetical protein
MRDIDELYETLAKSIDAAVTKHVDNAYQYILVNEPKLAREEAVAAEALKLARSKLSGAYKKYMEK